ncbi:NAD-dependent epimerase/dehydratase family protein [Bacillus massiliigorillae]|uniref:NAD-dependent epimerase/dehydratase family protein n=1 Tax=Bacillus massiliigorillae TaxID=1243664 RepID=UPI00039A837C
MKAVVLGASGGMGYALVEELRARKIKTVAAARNLEKLQAYFPSQDIIKASIDVFDLASLIQETKDCTHFFLTVNISYSKWEKDLPIIFGNVITAATKNNAKIILVDNIYAYGESNNNIVSEETLMQPHTKKGKIRLQLANMLHLSNVPYIIAHFPDFYGPNAISTLLHYTFDLIIQNKMARYLGDQKIAREFIYTPDGAKALLEIAINEDNYNQHWNIPGAGTITGEEIIAIAKSQTNYSKKVGTVNKNMLRFIGLFDAQLKEAVELYYLFERPVVLDGKKYEENIGKLPATPYSQGITETLSFMKRSIHS